MDDGWRILLGCDSFWAAVRSSCMMMRVMMNLKCTCRLFHESVPVHMVVRMAYSPFTATITKVDAQQMLGLTPYMLRAYASPIPFLTAFEVAYSRGLEECLRKRLARTENVERKWAVIRAQKRRQWDAEFQSNRSRLIAAAAKIEQSKRKAKTDELLRAEGVPELEGSRFSRLVWLAYRKHGVHASQDYLSLCAEGRAEFDPEQAAATSYQDERARFINLDRLDGIIGCGFPSEREQKLLAYLERDGMIGWNPGADGTRGSYFENCLAGVSPFYLPAMRLHYALAHVPWLALRYQEFRTGANGTTKDSGKPARGRIKKLLLAHKVKLDSCTIAQAMPRLLARVLF